jgi:MFS family permease
MITWLGRIRRALFIALTWAVVWAPLGVLIGMIVDPDGSMDEPWVAVGAYPGFLCGVVFSAVVGITDRRRRFRELSLSRAGAWGAVSGLLVIALPFIGFLGTPNTEHAFWRWRVMIIVAVTLLSSISAVGSVLLARMAKKRELGDASADVA